MPRPKHSLRKPGLGARKTTALDTRATDESPVSCDTPSDSMPPPPSQPDAPRPPPTAAAATTNTNTAAAAATNNNTKSTAAAAATTTTNAAAAAAAAAMAPPPPRTASATAVGGTPKAAPKPFKPFTPVAPAGGATPQSGSALSSAWADLEASLSKPTKPACSLGVRTPATTPIAAPPPAAPSTPQPALTTPTVTASTASPLGPAPSASNGHTAPPAPLFNPLSGAPVASANKPVGGKVSSAVKPRKLGASRVVQQSVADDWGASLDDEPEAKGESWGAAWDSPSHSPVKEPAKAADDPWERATAGSSLFAYEDASLHAAKAVTPPAEKARAVEAPAPEVVPVGGAAAVPSYLSKYANRTALGSSDFDLPQEAAPEPAPEPEFDRDAWLEKYAAAGAFGSDDMRGEEDKTGLARKLAGTGLEATKKLGGLAASVASSWLTRNSAANVSSKNDL